MARTWVEQRQWKKSLYLVQIIQSKDGNKEGELEVGKDQDIISIACPMDQFLPDLIYYFLHQQILFIHKIF